MRAHLASHQECEAKAISNEKLFYDVKRQLVAVSELVEVDSLLSLLGEVPTVAELREWLRVGLRGAWSDRWRKAPSSGRGGHRDWAWITSSADSCPYAVARCGSEFQVSACTSQDKRLRRCLVTY